MRILITGATGFLGSHLCRRLLAEGHQVRAFVRPTSDLAPLRGLTLECVSGDITDVDAVRPAVKGCEAVIHTAAFSHHADPARQFAVNSEGSRYVAEACRRAQVRRLVHVSSVAAIGVPSVPSPPADEQSAFNLADSGSPYPLSKRRAEEFVFLEVSRGLDAVIVNPATICGWHRGVFRNLDMLDRLRRAHFVPCFSGGLCLAHIQDVGQGIVAALSRGRCGQRYILGGENVTFRALLRRAAAALQVRPLLVPVPALFTKTAAIVLEPLAHWRGKNPRMSSAIHRYVNQYHFYDSGKARGELGYHPRDLDAILQDYLAGPRNNGALA